MLTLQTRVGTIRIATDDLYGPRYMVALRDKRGRRYIDSTTYEYRRRFHIDEFICRENIASQIVDDLTEMKWLITAEKSKS